MKRWLIMLFSLLVLLGGCSSGGDNNSAQGYPKTQVNDTTWDTLQWDDGNNTKTHQWAD